MDEQDCVNCRYVWSGGEQCHACTQKILKQREKEFIDNLFRDFKPRGKNPP